VKKRLGDLTDRVIASMAGPLLMMKISVLVLASAIAGFFKPASTFAMRASRVQRILNTEFRLKTAVGFTIVTKDDDFRGLSFTGCNHQGCCG